VFGIPDERLGEIVCAAIKIKKGSVLDQETVKNYCNGNVSLNETINYVDIMKLTQTFTLTQIARFKVPYHVLILDDFPKTVSGKIQKFKLREIMQDNLKNN